MTALHVDSVLEEQIKAAAAGGPCVGVWGTLAMPVGKKSLSPAEVDELARRVVARVEKALGRRAESFHVYENLNSFSLDAPPELIRALAAQPEVASLNPTKNELFAFEPIETTPAEAEAVRRHNARRGGSR